jgi:alkylation response protein AidB-like acyl-CoA dehydrogenase
MTFPLQPDTEPGRHLVTLMERHAQAFAPRAAELDREGRFAAENIVALQASGALSAAVPEALGGMGVASLYDLGVAVSRLAHGDASTAIGSWMHLIATHMMAGAFRALTAAGKAEPAARLERILRGVASEGHVIAVLGSEAGTYADHPRTRAVPAEGGGYAISGSKIFGTMAQAATHLNVAVQFDGKDGKPHAGFAFVPRAAAGVRVNDDWDALGMRASGSGSVVFDGCVIPESALSRMGEIGVETAAGLLGASGRNVGLLAACIGVAETARAEAIRTASSRRKLPSNRLAAERVAIQQLVGEIDVTLNAVRATFAYNARALDAAAAALTPRTAQLSELRRLTADTEAAKIFVERGCAEVVDRCLTVSGGAGYLSNSPLARHYRDVRALPFMFPQSTETLQYIGMVSLGLTPKLDL